MSSRKQKGSNEISLLYKKWNCFWKAAERKAQIAYSTCTDMNINDLDMCCVWLSPKCSFISKYFNPKYAMNLDFFLKKQCKSENYEETKKKHCWNLFCFFANCGYFFGNFSRYISYFNLLCVCANRNFIFWKHFAYSDVWIDSIDWQAVCRVIELHYFFCEMARSRSDNWMRYLAQQKRTHEYVECVSCFQSSKLCWIIKIIYHTDSQMCEESIIRFAINE